MKMLTALWVIVLAASCFESPCGDRCGRSVCKRVNKDPNCWLFGPDRGEKCPEGMRLGKVTFHTGVVCKCESSWLCANER